MKLSTILLFVTFLLGKDTQGGVKLKKGLWYFVVALFFLIVFVINMSSSKDLAFANLKLALLIICLGIYKSISPNIKLKKSIKICKGILYTFAVIAYLGVPTNLPEADFVTNPVWSEYLVYEKINLLLFALSLQIIFMVISIIFNIAITKRYKNNVSNNDTNIYNSSYPENANCKEQVEDMTNNVETTMSASNKLNYNYKTSNNNSNILFGGILFKSCIVLLLIVLAVLPLRMCNTAVWGWSMVYLPITIVVSGYYLNNFLSKTFSKDVLFFLPIARKMSKIVELNTDQRLKCYSLLALFFPYFLCVALSLIFDLVNAPWMFDTEYIGYTWRIESGSGVWDGWLLILAIPVCVSLVYSFVYFAKGWLLKNSEKTEISEPA